MMDIERTRRQLLETDDGFKQLAQRHHELDDRLKHLSSKSHLSDAELLEEATLKKQKLRLKDEMEAIMRRQPPGQAAPTPA